MSGHPTGSGSAGFPDPRAASVFYFTQADYDRDTGVVRLGYRFDDGPELLEQITFPGAPWPADPAAGAAFHDWKVRLTNSSHESITGAPGQTGVAARPLMIETDSRTRLAVWGIWLALLLTSCSHGDRRAGLRSITLTPIQASVCGAASIRGSCTSAIYDSCNDTKSTSSV